MIQWEPCVVPVERMCHCSVRIRGVLHGSLETAGNNRRLRKTSHFTHIFNRNSTDTEWLCRPGNYYSQAVKGNLLRHIDCCR